MITLASSRSRTCSMLQLEVPIISHAALPGAYEHLTLRAPTLATRAVAGADTGGAAYILAGRAVSACPCALAEADAVSGTVTLIANSDQFPRVRTGDMLDVLGPVGRGWNLPSDVRNIS